MAMISPIKLEKRTNGLWFPSTGGIYPLLKKLEKRKVC